MANIRIKDLPLNVPIPSSWVVAEVITSPGVTTTSKSPLSSFVAAAGLNYKVWQSTTSSMTSLSAGWQTTTNNVNASAQSWNSATTTLSTTSANWSAAYNTVISYKPYWDLGYTLGSSTYTTVRTNSGSWQDAGQVGVSTYTTVNAGSALWNAGGGASGAVYLTVNGLSAAWTSATKSVTALSSHWEGAFTNLYPNSGNWNSVYTLINTTTATTFGVNNLSALGNVNVTGSIIGIGNEGVLSDEISSNDVGNGLSTLSLNFTSGIYIGGSGVLNSSRVASDSVTTSKLTATYIDARYVTGNSVPVYEYISTDFNTGSYVWYDGFALAANSVYELVFELYYRKITLAGTVTYTLENLAGAAINGQAIQTIATGAAAFSAPTKSYIINQTGTSVAFSATPSLTVNANHHAELRYIIRTGSSNGVVKLQTIPSAGSITIYAGSFAKLTRIV